MRNSEDIVAELKKCYEEANGQIAGEQKKRITPPKNYINLLLGRSTMTDEQKELSAKLQEKTKLLLSELRDRLVTEKENGVPASKISINAKEAFLCVLTEPEKGKPHPVRILMQALESLLEPLVPYLGEAEQCEIREMYDRWYPNKRMMFPNQKKIYEKLI